MSSIYFIGIGGTAMASVAVALSHEGHAITGSDTGIYPPMSTYLDEHNIRYHGGFSSQNLADAQADLVVVGNAISRGNEELEYALDHRLELISMAELVRRELIGRNTSIVVAGTHGKTTTTSLIAWLLEDGGLKPGFLVGGIPENFGIGCRPSARKEDGFFVTEGDEYDTAFFDKRSKFLHYRPDIAIINNVEFDHADIFASLEEIKLSFTRFVNLIPSRGLLVVNGDDPSAMEVARGARCRVETFGFGEGCDWSARDIATYETMSSFELRYKANPVGRAEIPLFGRHNIMNTLAALAVATRTGIPMEIALRGLQSFLRPKRRMEVVGTYPGNITLVEDFAHHPTAIRMTLDSIADRWPGRRIIACFEPRSNTSTRNIFQDDFPPSFRSAAIVILGEVHRPERYAPERRLDPRKIKAVLEREGKRVLLAGGGKTRYPYDIVDFLEGSLKHNDVVVLLTNGSFAGLKELLQESFQKFR